MEPEIKYERMEQPLKEYIPPGSHVWAIARHYNNGKSTCFVAILPAIVKGVYITETNVEYDLTTPDGQAWGDTIIADEVSQNFDDLTYKMRKEWYRFAEWK